jgi:SAM-dependent methyltransferase
MRLAEINAAYERVSRAVQHLPAGDFSDSVGIDFALREKERPVRAVKRLLAGPALAMRRAHVLRQLGVSLPFKADAVGIGEGFVDDAAWAYLLSRLPPLQSLSVLIPGCYMGGEDVQFWVRRGVRRLEGIDVYGLTRHWASIVPALRERWGVPVSFRQASIESIPFADATFDVVTSAAVLEHVRNINAMVEETARVQKAGGFALHSFGPLYYTFGADHCIGAYGFAAGYDHLLLDEPEYRKRIADGAFFETATGNSDLGFWAINDQFSFATAAEYLERFKIRFDVVYVGVKISREGLAYRARFPERWERLTSAGIHEADLLVKGLVILLRKPLPETVA